MDTLCQATLSSSQLEPNKLLRLPQVVLVVKNLPASARDVETQVQFLGWEAPLEKEMAIHSSILAWRILRTEEPGGLQSWGCRVRHK